MLEPESAPTAETGPKVEVPVDVIAPHPTVPIVAIFLLPSRTTALFAAAVPSVIPSNFSRSVSLMSAEPITKLPPEVMFPATIILCEASMERELFANVPSKASSVLITKASALSSIPIIVFNVECPKTISLSVPSASEPRVIVPLKIALPASEPSNVTAVTAEPPSSTLIITSALVA